MSKLILDLLFKIAEKVLEKGEPEIETWLIHEVRTLSEKIEELAKKNHEANKE